MLRGFGSGDGPRGVLADRPRVPHTMLVQPLSLAANQAQRFDLTGTVINMIVLTLLTGQVNGYLGDNTSSGGQAAVTPQFLGLAGETRIIPLAESSDYIITLQEGVGSTATGAVIFEYHQGG